MATFPAGIYAPPGAYSQTNFETPVQDLSAAVRIPLLIGTGSEVLVQTALEVVRGSSASVDQRIIQEDETDRAVVSISDLGQITLGAFDGDVDAVRIRGSGPGAGPCDNGILLHLDTIQHAVKGPQRNLAEVRN